MWGKTNASDAARAAEQLGWQLPPTATLGPFSLSQNIQHVLPRFPVHTTYDPEPHSCLPTSQPLSLTVKSILMLPQILFWVLEVASFQNVSPPESCTLVLCPQPVLCFYCGFTTLTLRLLMSYIYIYIYIYIYGAPILDVSRSHTTTQHSR